MPFVLVLAGLLLIVTGAKGTYSQFGQQLSKDFTGDGNFTYWIASIGAVGSIGYIDALKEVSRLFLALILIAMVLSNRGVFQQFQNALKSGPSKIESSPLAAPSTTPAPRGDVGTPLQEFFKGWFK
jgi:hypothetical protein